ncbi:MAG: ABC transporter substrate-binding protein, partial [Anaerolineales bacterium]
MMSSHRSARGCAAVVAALVVAACGSSPGPGLEPVIVEQVVTRVVQVEVLPPPFREPHPILSDVRLRRAVARCTDKQALVASVFPWMSPEMAAELVMDSFVPRQHWAYPGDQAITQYPFDPGRAAALLDEAGWRLVEGAEFRQNRAGEELALKLTTTTAVLRQAWAQVLESGLAECGIRLVRFHTPASWFFGDTTGLGRRDFELAGFAWVNGADPDGLTLYRCEAIPDPENAWQGQNYMGWCNPAADEAIEKANASLAQEDRARAYRRFQEVFARDEVSIPLFSRPLVYAYNSRLAGFVATAGQDVYTWNAAGWSVPGREQLAIGFSAEPASLFDVVEDSFITQLITALTDGVRYASPGFAYQPGTQTPLSAIDSGLVEVNTVSPGEGDPVIGTSGQVAALTDGVEVWDAEGQRKIFTGEPIAVPQLAVRYVFAAGLTWSDGAPVSQKDFETYYRVACGHEGSRLEPTCERVEDIEFHADGYTIRWLPGYQAPSYALAPFGYYPAHQPLETGGVLADEPAGRWDDHPEVRLGRRVVAGPYRVVDWEPGRRIVLEANPHYYLGLPESPRLILEFVERDDVASKLIGGSVDLAGWDLVGEAGPTVEALAEAAGRGEIELGVVPSATWEHID